MAEVRYKVCDRCGAKISQHSKKLVKLRRVKMVFNICGWMHEYEHELCGPCTEGLDYYMSSGKEVKKDGKVQST